MEAIAMQDGMRAFIEALSSVQTDRFVRVMGRLESRGAQGELERLKAELDRVKRKISDVNCKRDALRLEKQDLEETTRDLDRVPQNKGARDLVQLRLTLVNLVADLDGQIAGMRPGELHEEKARIKKEMANRRLLASLAGMLRTTANEHGD